MKADKVPHWFNRARELALAEWQKNRDFRRDDVFLRNPAVERTVERFIRRIVLPAARAALKPTRFTLSGYETSRNLYRPPDERGNLVRLCLDDPDCSGQERPWCTRLEVQCTINGASLLTDYLCIYLPLKTDFKLIVDVLSETAEGGFPAELSMDQNSLGKRVFQVAFKHIALPSASAYGYLPITEKLDKKLNAHCDFAEIACEIEQRPNDVLLFRRLLHQVNEAFEI